MKRKEIGFTVAVLILFVIGYMGTVHGNAATVPKDKSIHLADNSMFIVLSTGEVYMTGKPFPLSDVYDGNFLPMPIGVENTRQLSVGKTHLAYIDGTLTLYGIGSGSYEQITAQTDSILPSFNSVKGVIIAQDIVDVACGHYHTLFLDSQGKLYSMGRNDKGQLGIGKTTRQNRATHVLSNVAAIAAKGDTSFAIDKEGNLYAWGDNGYGQLGTGDTKHQNKPKKVLTKVKEVYPGGKHTFVKKSDGNVYGWGNNANGQLGFKSSTAKQLSPQKIGKYATVAAGTAHSLFLDENNVAYGAGSNHQYQLGFSKKGNVAKPTVVKKAISAIYAGDKNSVLIDMQGKYYHIMGTNQYTAEEPREKRAKRELPVGHKTVVNLGVKYGSIESALSALEPDANPYRGLSIASNVATQGWEVKPAAYAGTYQAGDNFTVLVSTNNTTESERSKIESIANEVGAETKHVEYSLNQLNRIMDYAVYCTTLNADFKNDFVVAGIDMQNNVVEIGIKNLDSEKETRYKSLMGHLDGITMVNATAIIDD